MLIVNHECESCGSDFAIQYDETECERDPMHCPFCGEYIALEEDDFIDPDAEEE